MCARGRLRDVAITSPMHPLVTLLALSLATAFNDPRDDSADESAPFGFRDHEVYELGSGCADLESADIDGDGLRDLALIDHHRSRVVLLLRRAASEPDAELRLREVDGPNRAAFDGRYDVVRCPVERRVRELALGDFDRDGRADVAWVLDGGELVVRISDAKGERARESVAQRIDELADGSSALEAVDLDGDGVLDLVAAGSSTLVWLRGEAKGTFAAARRIDSLASGFGSLFIADFDGDGRRDLAYAYFGVDDPIRMRLQTAAGTFGPRLDFDVPQLRSARAVDLDGDQRYELLAVFKLSGRLAALELAGGDAKRRGLARFALPPAEKRGGARSFAVGDLDGDGAAEVLVAEGGTAQIVRYSAPRGSRALHASTHPTLVGAADPCLADIDGDGVRELLTRSTSERMLGVARLDAHGALEFPRTLPIDGEPVALTCADIDADGLSDALVCVAQGEGRARKHRLEVWRGSKAGLVASASHVLEGLARTPTALRMVDLDRDGALDALAFLPGEKTVPALLVQRERAFLVDERGENAPGLGILAGATPANVNVGDIDGDGLPELLAASANFARALTFETDSAGRATPRVLEQIAGPAPDSRVVGVVSVPAEAGARPSVALCDARTNELLLHTRDANGALVLTTRVDVERIDFQGLVEADVDGDGARDVVVLGANEFGIAFARETDLRLVDFASYEPEKDTQFLDALAAGDLNGDGATDVVVSELGKHALVLLDARARSLRRGLGFPVFEQKSASGAEASGREPREIVCGELDGDGKADLALLVHDKLLIYLQE